MTAQKARVPNRFFSSLNVLYQATEACLRFKSAVVLYTNNEIIRSREEEELEDGIVPN